MKPNCECMGPFIFPVITCKNLNDEKEAARIKRLRFPIGNIGKFSFFDSKITKFDSFKMPIELRIKFIQIERTKITEIDLFAFFASRFTLQRLQITHNNLKRLRFSDLRYFESLQYLDLYYNSLKSVEDNAFGFNPFLKSIDLSFNSISYIGSYAFYELPNLRNLDLRFNKLKIVNNNAFTSRMPPPNLHDSLTLDLSHNQMFLIAEDAFTRTVFKKLDLSHNRLKRFESKHFEPIVNTMVALREGTILVE
ncbi:oplophorus-luciferin 2-monooxygenase non-catalytic subunit-like protein, partial [Dinothrombium tinctorium]